ncbi:MAG TPA: CBS domain-containing protein [Burkholderiales bacterium]|nr:CBS domain-containing protein [Burkholderiales bacterium]
MASTEELSFAFLEAHPADAARVLERIAPQNVAALISQAPVRLAAPVLRAMLPLHAARCLETVDEDAAAGMLRAMGPQAGVAVLHYVPEARRNALLAQLPTALAMAFRLLLGYPEDTVGAWMNPRVLALPPDATAHAALQRLREAEGENTSSIFVIGSGQRLLGQIDLPDVLKAAADAPLSKVMRDIRYSLPARAPIRAVEEHAGWDDYQMLPVLERENRFVGALDRGVLARALLRTRRIRTGNDYGDVIADVAGGYWLGVASLIQLAVALLPASRPQINGESYEC